MTTDSSVPSEWLELAEQLDRVAAAVRHYLTLDPKPWPDSICSRERAREDEFADLPFDHPVVYTELAPLQYLGSAQDHLIALAATIRTPRTVMASFVLLRTLIVGAAYAAYIADPKIDLRERVRRAMNAYLDSTTEQMRLMSDETDPAELAEFTRLQERRRDLAAGARTLGWSVNRPEASKAAGGWPKDWWIGDKPLTEMRLLGNILDGFEASDGPSRALYRWLSASSHVQPHALLAFVNRAHTTSRGDGSALAAIGMDGQLLVLLGLTATGALTIAMDRCVGLYGWPQERWQTEVIPIFRGLRSALPPT